MPLGAKVAKDVVSISHLNYRDHRKIVVIDGEIGYTGGYNVGQEYVDGGERFARWRDTHVRVTGQVVGELEALFAARWFDQTKEDVLHRRVPPGAVAGRRRDRHPLPGRRAVRGGPVEVVTARPHAGRRQRRRRVWIQSPYFIPEVGLYDTMINAALSGVDVRFMMTGVPDKKVPYWAAWTYFRPLLKAGVKVYLYEAGFLHAKTLTADGQITAIGTMNMDIRSLRLHKELMLWMYDDELAGRQEQLFEEDIANSHEVTLVDLDVLSLTMRFRNSFMRLLSLLHLRHGRHDPRCRLESEGASRRRRGALADGVRGRRRHRPDAPAPARPGRAPALGGAARRGPPPDRGDHRGPGQDRPGLPARARTLDHADRAAGRHDALVHDAAHRPAHPGRAGHRARVELCWQPAASCGCPTASRSGCSTGSWTAAARRCVRTACPPTRLRLPAAAQPGARAGALAAALRGLHVPRLHLGHGLQPHRRHATTRLEQARDDGTVGASRWFCWASSSRARSTSCASRG